MVKLIVTTKKKWRLMYRYLNRIIEPYIIDYPAGEVGFNLPEDVERTFYNAKLCFDVNSHKDMLILLMFLHRYNWYKYTEIYVPYCPYLRDDKINNKAQPAFAHYLKKYKNILTTSDPHFNQMTENNSLTFTEDFRKVLNKPTTIVLADKSAHRTVDFLKNNNVYINLCDSLPFLNVKKERDNATDKITKIDFEKNLPYLEVEKQPKQFLIVDDICDGGGTFIPTIEMLKIKYPLVPILLYVTHGVFSKGTEHLYDAGLHEIYTTNTYPKIIDLGTELDPKFNYKVVGFVNCEERV